MRRDSDELFFGKDRTTMHMHVTIGPEISGETDGEHPRTYAQMHALFTSAQGFSCKCLHTHTYTQVIKHMSVCLCAYLKVYAATLRNSTCKTGQRRFALKKITKRGEETKVHALAEQRALATGLSCPFIIQLVSCFQTKVPDM